VNRKVLRQAIFDSDFFGHGGEKRTAQISNLLTANNIEYILVPGLVKQKISLANRIKIKINQLHSKYGQENLPFCPDNQ
jgi:hypothetical protein